MKVLIASSNSHKIREIKSLLKKFNAEVFSLSDFPSISEIPETGSTLEENALLKAKAYHLSTGMTVIADDTGLFVDALNGNPGVYSARFAGKNATYEINCDKLIAELKLRNLDFSNAYFKTVICYLENENNYKFFEGMIEGKVITQKLGYGGFGYDPVFVPKGFVKTFAELTENEKNEISHRGQAIKKFMSYLESL
ncbi:MAG: RdgB/HAM1 family non-canonical purine NTP pyrophosphatase [Ignavibacteriaceae bacterium]|nr:MAG: RdgB/HAM1 family non-canonical purine NTP pyrophosphatase [Chlorobiota bacterium]KXK05806.1 MAG: Xanthosine triphosphate pyrophosphatase [Chlorobi bacterium OLB4]MBV6398363.1 dITP/XTP pyrophosphatase [Ignavibacteria bacterium]MCC6886046.1 RdgB/HAM1 family non-canonical purine NTP pyrophosphatase [Ignavibacteriales bacterium]MCE7952703.1 RdgB/HAM1 family non-canonical purine NTP pyrophosphatase [Chlorobi bacterium CHB7]MDL1886814.1 RdgB/HAM1 family non-canonical purine NTP pyrophosphata